MFGWIIDVIWRWFAAVQSASMPPSIPAPEMTLAYAHYVASSTMALPSKTDESGIGSMYGTPDDKWLGSGKMACKPHDAVPQDKHICAHRFYPCGTILIIEYPKTGQRTWCKVMDRGPYGANVFAEDGSKVIIDGKPAWYIKIKKNDTIPSELCPDGNCTSKWRGVLDMGPATARAMGHPGWGYIRVWTLKRVVDQQKYLAKKQTRPQS